MNKKSFSQGLFRVSDSIDPPINSSGMCAIWDIYYASLGRTFEFLILMPSVVLTSAFRTKLNEEYLDILIEERC